MYEDAQKLTQEEKNMLKSGKWVLCMVSKMGTIHEHEIIHVVGTESQDFCPSCMSKEETKA